MANLAKAGNAIWNACNHSKQVIEVVVWDAAKPEPTGHLPLSLERAGVSREVSDLVDAIHSEV